MATLRVVPLPLRSCLPRHWCLASSVIGSSALVEQRAGEQDAVPRDCPSSGTACAAERAKNTAFLGQSLAEPWQHCAAEAASNCARLPGSGVRRRVLVKAVASHPLGRRPRERMSTRSQEG